MDIVAGRSSVIYQGRCIEWGETGDCDRVNLSDNREGWDEERSISHCDHGGATGGVILLTDEERPPDSGIFILRSTRLYLSNLMDRTFTLACFSPCAVKSRPGV